MNRFTFLVTPKKGDSFIAHSTGKNYEAAKQQLITAINYQFTGASYVSIPLPMPCE